MQGGGWRLTGVEWVSVTRESNTRVEQVVRILMELKCESD